MKRNAISIEDAVLLDNSLWFILSDYKNLVSIDIETKKRKSYTIPTGGSYTQKRAFASMAVVNSKIYLIPFADRTLLQFDVSSEKFEEIKIDSRIIENQSLLFMGVGVYQNYLFVMGVFAPAILRVNTVNNHVDYITDWQKNIEKLIFDFGDAYFRKQSVVLDDKLYVPFCNANAVLEIDCNSMETVIHSIGEEKQGYSGICFDGKSLWLSPRKNGSMVRWDLSSNRVDNIRIIGLEEAENKFMYIGVILSNDKICLLPSVKSQTLCEEEGKVIELKGEYSFVQSDEIKIIYYEKNKGIVTIIDRESGTQSEIEIDKVEIDVNIEEVLCENYKVIIEDSVFDIGDFLRFVQKSIL